jgi:hypothetical protein
VEAMTAKVLVAIGKTETGLAGNVKTEIVLVEIAKKVQRVARIVHVVNSLMRHQNFHSARRQNEFVRCASMLMLCSLNYPKPIAQSQRQF